MLGIDMSNVTSATGGNRPGAGGYVIRIQRATVRPKKQDIEIEYDICEGEFAGYYQSLCDRKGSSRSSWTATRTLTTFWS